MIVDVHGVSIEFVSIPGSVSDTSGLSMFTMNLPDHSVLYAGKAYTHYELEDLLHSLEGIDWVAKRKQVHKRHKESSRKPSFLQSRQMKGKIV